MGTTVSQLFRQAGRRQGSLTTHHFASLAGRFARLGSRERFLSDTLGHTGVFFEEARQTVVADGRDDALDVAVSEFGFRLPLELRIRNAHRDDGRQPFAKVIARGNVIFEDVFFFSIVVE